MTPSEQDVERVAAVIDAHANFQPAKYMVEDGVCNACGLTWYTGTDAEHIARAALAAMPTRTLAEVIKDAPRVVGYYEGSDYPVTAVPVAALELGERVLMPTASPVTVTTVEELADRVLAHFRNSAAVQRENDIAAGYDQGGTTTPNEAEWYQWGNTAAHIIREEGGATVLAPTPCTSQSAPPVTSEVTAEQVEAMVALAEAGPFINDETGGCLTCDVADHDLPSGVWLSDAGPEVHGEDCTWARAFRAASVLVAGEGVDRG